MSREWTYSSYDTGYRTTSTGVTIEWEFEGGGYGWKGWALTSKMNGEQKLYAAYIDSGCSCYSMYGMGPDDLSWTPNLKEAASTLSRSIRDEDYGPGDEKWAPDEKVTVLSSLSQAVAKLR